LHLSHAAGGFEMATSLSGDGSGGAPALAGARWSIHDVIMDDLSTKYTGPGVPFEISNGWPQNPLNTVTINHVTAFPDVDSFNSHMMLVGNKVVTAPMYGLVFTNNLVVTGRYPVWNAGGTSSCAARDIPVTSISKCFTTYTFSNNALVASPSQFPPSSWPSGNFFQPTVPDVQFVNYNAGNYELQTSSPYKAMGTDGKDLGADVAGLTAMLANVE
jgi:hypothetical protein